MLPFDLHVLSMPPAFNLSQDQTLHLKKSLRLSPHLFSVAFATDDLGILDKVPTRMIFAYDQFFKQHLHIEDGQF
jgi:hypothetical protein